MGSARSGRLPQDRRLLGLRGFDAGVAVDPSPVDRPSGQDAAHLGMRPPLPLAGRDAPTSGLPDSDVYRRFQHALQ
jgi:hypothetical protein